MEVYVVIYQNFDDYGVTEDDVTVYDSLESIASDYANSQEEYNELITLDRKQLSDRLFGIREVLVKVPVCDKNMLIDIGVNFNPLKDISTFLSENPIKINML